MNEVNWIGMIFLTIVLGVVLIVGAIQGGKLVLGAIELSVMKEQRFECAKWADWERVYPRWDHETQTGYYITEWQKAQCDAVGVALDAHILQN